MGFSDRGIANDDRMYRSHQIATIGSLGLVRRVDHDRDDDMDAARADA